MLTTRSVVSMCSVVMMLVGAGVVSGQEYPNKPIRIVTLPAGGGSDFSARLIAQGISGPLGQPVIVDNRGAVTLIAEYVSKASPDGYTLLLVGSTLWVGPLLQKLPYDAVRDFSPISTLTRDTAVLVVHPSVPANSVKELIALAKARPGELNYSSGSQGSPNHLAAELFKSMAGVNIVGIAYKGTAQAVNDLIGGQVQLMFVQPELVLAHVKAGRLRVLAVTSATPSPLAPGLPTIAASGLPGYEMTGVTSMLAPAKTPDAIINQLNREMVRFVNRADVKERFLTAGAEVVGSSPEQAADTITSDVARISKVIKDARIRID